MATIPHRAPAKHRAANEQLLARARRTTAGGDNSSMRVLPYHLPLVAERGDGSRVWDVEGNEYIDMNMAYGPLLFGHRPRKVLEAVTTQINRFGSQLGFPTEIGMRVAEKLKQLFPSMEMMRFSSSGSEAVAAAIRLARGYTGRSKVVVFEGHYHGSSDQVFHRYHAELDDLPNEGYAPALPGSNGMNGAPYDVICVEWNNTELLARCLSEQGHDVAAVIMEPIAGNSGVIPPQRDYLSQVRKLTNEYETLLIFDEVITGLRVAAGGAQQRYDVRPDITVVSKALGGGFPVSAFGASAEIMDLIAQRRVFHGGVYSGNATVMAACEAVLDEILENGPAIYEQLYSTADQLCKGLNEVFYRHHVPHVVQSVGPMVSMFVTKKGVARLRTYREVRRWCDFEGYIRFQHAAQRNGVYFHPNQFEPMFLSTAHTPEDIGQALDRIEDACRCTWHP